MRLVKENGTIIPLDFNDRYFTYGIEVPNTTYPEIRHARLIGLAFRKWIAL